MGKKKAEDPGGEPAAGAAEGAAGAKGASSVKDASAAKAGAGGAKGASTAKAGRGGGADVTPRPMLLDEVMAVFDANLVRHTIVDAAPHVTFAAIARTDAMGDPLVRALFGLRAAPERIAALVQGRPAPEPMTQSITFGQVLDHAEGFTLLGEDPPYEVVSGLIGKLWQKDFGMRSFADAVAFRRFVEPGYAKTVADFSARPYGATRTLLTYESRTVTTDDEARRNFRRYWLALKPGIAYVMSTGLRLVKTEAERATKGA